MPTRRISFDTALADLPKHFAADEDVIQSHLAAALSGVFPDGEDFFVAAVRNYRNQITDPDLLRQVNGFIGQESMHGRVHRSFNARLSELGYYTKFAERRTRFMIRQQQRIMSNERQLALTAALEHFTATLAELLLREPKARQLLGHEAARQVFVWHALEESEHKAVAFDVYRAIGGSERIRVQVMRQTRFLFVAVTAFQVALAVLADPKSRQRGVLRQSIWRFRRSPLWDRSVWEQLKDYDRPDFHPDDSDTSELVAEWREALFGVSGELQDNLSTSAA
ncbi:MAG: metal-dependent hydrolase [Acidimicrobiia bacterium]|nr:metal-dependent hydrolase [Acidimicrobiia bacterium]MBP8182004.1 metal-dependent hydrolase [Acidimicrobiia bacterium]